MKDNVDFAAAIVKELTSVIDERINKAIDKKFTDVNGNKLDIYELVRKFAMETIGITEKGKLNPEFIKLIKDKVAQFLAEEGLEEIEEDECPHTVCDDCNKSSCCDDCDLTDEEDNDEDEELNNVEDDIDWDDYTNGYDTGYDTGYKKGYDAAYHDGIREGIYRTVTTLNDFFKRNNLKHRIVITNDNTALNIIYNANLKGFGIPLQDNSNNPRCKEKYDKNDNEADILSEFHDLIQKFLNKSER